jgi:hypothetical protein
MGELRSPTINDRNYNSCVRQPSATSFPPSSGTIVGFIIATTDGGKT